MAGSWSSGGSGSGTDWASLLAGLGAGYMQYKGSKDANKQIDKMNAPQPYSNTSGINQGPMEDYNKYFLGEMMNIYQRPGGGGGGGAPRNVGANVSQNTQGLADFAANQAMQGGTQLHNAGSQFLQGAMGGPTNPWQQEAFDYMKGGPMSDFISQAMQGGFGGGGGGGGGNYGMSSSIGGGGGANLGENRWTNEMFDRATADPSSNPHLAQVLADAKAASQGGYEQELARLKSMASNAGRGNLMASGAGTQALTGAMGARDQQLQSQANQMYYQDYNNQMDRQQQLLGMGGGLMNERDIASMNANTARQGQASAAGASRYATDRGTDMQRMQMALQGIGMQGDWMGGMANQLANNQLTAAGMVPGYDAASQAGLKDAFGMNQSIDQMRQSAAQANANRQQQWAGQQASMPWDNLFNAGKAMNMFGKPFYETYTQGTNAGAGIMPMDPWANALGGFGSGAGTAMDLFGKG